MGGSKDECLVAWNPNLEDMADDYLYHLALGRKDPLEEMFGDVRFVCVGGTARRMKAFAYFMKDQLGIRLPAGVALEDMSKKGHRYSMFKVGPVLSISHGMGGPSLSILLHELLKLVKYAKCQDPVFLRLGTSGGIGVPPGSVVVTDRVVNGYLEPVYELPVLAQKVQIPAHFDIDLIDEIVSIGEDKFDGRFGIYKGTTMSTLDFYEGQARLDGAFCRYTESQKMEFLQRLKRDGVTNIEMESLVFGAMCHLAGIPAAIICVTLLDRLNGDQIVPGTNYDELQQRPQQVAAEFIKFRLG